MVRVAVKLVHRPGIEPGMPALLSIETDSDEITVSSRDGAPTLTAAPRPAGPAGGVSREARADSE